MPRPLRRGVLRLQLVPSRELSEDATALRRGVSR